MNTERPRGGSSEIEVLPFPKENFRERVAAIVLEGGLRLAAKILGAEEERTEVKTISPGTHGRLHNHRFTTLPWDEGLGPQVSSQNDYPFNRYLEGCGKCGETRTVGGPTVWPFE